MTSVDLRTTLSALRLPNPVLSASGCAGTGRELGSFSDLADLAAFVTRSVTLDTQAGGPAPRLLETPSGMLAAVGHNPGLQGFLATELPDLVRRGAQVIVSMAATSWGEFAELARRLGTSPGVSGIEVNLAGRSAESGGRVFAAEPYLAAKAITVVRRESPTAMPVFAKLSPDVHSIVDVARAVADAGADGVVLVQGPTGLVIDPDSMRPALGAGEGTLSGPAVRPLAVRCVWDVAAALPGLAVIGVGGVRTGADALEMLLAGAGAVQVGSVLLGDPSAPARILAELRQELQRRGLGRVSDVVGLAHEGQKEHA